MFLPLAASPLEDSISLSLSLNIRRLCRICIYAKNYAKPVLILAVMLSVINAEFTQAKNLDERVFASAYEKEGKSTILCHKTLILFFCRTNLLKSRN